MGVERAVLCSALGTTAEASGGPPQHLGAHMAGRHELRELHQEAEEVLSAVQPAGLQPLFGRLRRVIGR